MRRFTCRVPPADAGRRLDLAVHEWLSGALGRPLSKATIRRLIMSGAIRLDGRPVRRPGAGLGEGARLDASIDECRLPARAGAEAAERAPVLFEDRFLIAVAKPAGLSTHASADPGRPDLFTLVRRQVGGGAPAYLGLHHRLDRSTSGVVLFTKDPAANAGLAAQFEGRQVEKTYHALTARPSGREVEESWRVEGQLAATGSGRRARMVRVSEGGRLSATRFSLLARARSALLVEARPETGRKHQIRAHLCECGLPILGDERYGGARRVGTHEIPRAMLHARRLSLSHPVTGACLAIDCPYPDDFRLLLEALRLDSKPTPAP
jgi:RluA family pseudouridine synthase